MLASRIGRYVRRDSGEKLGIGWTGRLELEALWRREQSAPQRAATGEIPERSAAVSKEL